MKPMTWSYSALSAFETCPHRYYLTKVSKELKEPQTAASLWGNRVHKALELRVGQGTPLPETLKQYDPVAETVASVRARGATVDVEQKLALTKNFTPTTWFAPDVWVRAITDVTMERGNKAVVLDYKTGKPTPDSAQLKLAAAVVFAHRPSVQRITCSFLWLKHGKNTSDTFTREDVPGIWQEFMPRVQRLEIALKENKFPPNPSGLCREWCPVGRRLCGYCGKD